MKFTKEYVIRSEKYVFVKNVYEWARHGIATIYLSRRDSQRSGNVRVSVKDKVLGAAVSKEGHADSF